MRNFWLVFRLQLKNMLRKDPAKGNKRRIAWIAGLAVSYAVIAAAFIFTIVLMGGAFADFSLQSEFVALILLCGLMVVLVFGIVTVLTSLYFSRDTEFFLTLPVKPSAVFAAKLMVVYVTELCVAALLLVPCLIAAGVVMHVPAQFYVLLPVAVLCTPAIPLFVAAVVSVPIMYIVSFFRNRGALGSIFVLLLFGAFFTVYYMGVSKMQNIDPETVDLAAIQHIFVAIANSVYPLYALARAMTGDVVFGLGSATSFAVNFFICIGSIVAVGGIALLVSATVYRRGAAGQLEGSSKRKIAAGQYRGSGVLKALMKKEWREISRTPSFALNCLLGIVMCPILVAFVGYSVNVSSVAGDAAQAGEALSAEATQILSVVLRMLMLWMLIFMSVGTNSAPSTAFSREGEKFYYCRLMPVDYKTQVRAKSYVYLAIGMVSSLLGAVVMAIVDFDVSFFLCSLVFLPLVVFAFVHFGIYLDMAHPKLQWVTPNEVMKHNKNVLLAVLAALLVSLLLAVAGAATYIGVFRAAGATAASAAMWAVLLALGLGAAAGSYALVYKNCDRMLDAVRI